MWYRKSLVGSVRDPPRSIEVRSYNMYNRKSQSQRTDTLHNRATHRSTVETNLYIEEEPLIDFVEATSLIAT